MIDINGLNSDINKISTDVLHLSIEYGIKICIVNITTAIVIKLECSVVSISKLIVIPISAFLSELPLSVPPTWVS